MSQLTLTLASGAIGFETYHCVLVCPPATVTFDAVARANADVGTNRGTRRIEVAADSPRTLRGVLRLQRGVWRESRSEPSAIVNGCADGSRDHH